MGLELLYFSTVKAVQTVHKQIEKNTSRFFSRTFLAEFSFISEVRSFSLLACILEQECRKYLGINLRKYLYFSQG